MSQATERTRLLSGGSEPQYVFDSDSIRDRKHRVKQFQCCLCAIFLSIFLSGLTIAVLYGINHIPVPVDNSTVVPINGSQVEPVLVLLSRSWPLSDTKLKKNQSNYNGKQWEEAMAAGETQLTLKDDLEKNSPSLPVFSPSYRHQKVVATSEKARNLSRIGYVEEYATRHMHRNRTNNNHALVEKLCFSTSNTTKISDFCNQTQITCNEYKMYRSLDGTCNNLKYPRLYGVAYKPFRRALPPDYADGISKPRATQTGTPLPSARTVSLIVHRPYYRDDPKFTVMLAVWGQFLDHDITATALSQKSNGSSISCCNLNPTILSPECLPVELDPKDPFTQYNVTCIEFVRSAPAATCCLGPREQLNQATPFIDGSVVYGVEEPMVKKLRSFTGGLLKMYVTEDNRTLLPISDDLTDGCNREEQRKNGKYCFMTGDARANENLHLTSMHLLWARHHNYLAKSLSKVNPKWDDERIFQETRRIIGAQMQHITYKEFLPIILGPQLMEHSGLNPQTSNYFKGYNDSIDPSIANNFATAAFRFAHTIIPGLMKSLGNDTSSPEFIQLHKMLFDPFQLYQPGELDKALRGAMNTSIEATDAYFTNELKLHLFEKTSETQKSPKLCGLDLVSLNIQRGRDHGLPGYTKWRHHCGLSTPTNFSQLKDDMDQDSLHNIQAIYTHVDDIDLYTGALSEKPLTGSIVGPTITCLLLDQFVRIKYGDRFWYENPYKFPLKQLDEIRTKTSLAKIICDNSDDVAFAQPLVMERVGTGNEYKSCGDFPSFDFNLWKDEIKHASIRKQFFSVIGVKPGQE